MALLQRMAIGHQNGPTIAFSCDGSEWPYCCVWLWGVTMALLLRMAVGRQNGPALRMAVGHQDGPAIAYGWRKNGQQQYDMSAFILYREPQKYSNFNVESKLHKTILP